MNLRIKIATHESIRRLLGNNPIIPVPIEAIVLSQGIKLLPYDLGNNISGVLIRENDSATIGYNKNESRVRNRFTIAHELGHYVLHEGKELFVDRDFSVMYRINNENINSEEEIEANEYAACILMPEELVLAELKNIHFDYTDDGAIKELAKKFDVSSVAMSVRISNLLRY
jgi:Zn-dependent peptidase ImmA (M78 family)